MDGSILIWERRETRETWADYKSGVAWLHDLITTICYYKHVFFERCMLQRDRPWRFCHQSWQQCQKCRWPQKLHGSSSLSMMGAPLARAWALYCLLKKRKSLRFNSSSATAGDATSFLLLLLLTFGHHSICIYSVPVKLSFSSISWLPNHLLCKWSYRPPISSELIMFTPCDATGIAIAFY